MLKGILITGLIIMVSSIGTVFASGNKDKNHSEKPATSQLRCWQQGKLLFDELNWHSFTIANKENVINFTKDESEDRSLSLINMGDTVCLYQQNDKH